MKDILGYIETRIAELDRHPLFGWLADDKTPLKDRLQILPSIATVAIGFRDVNKWVLRYPTATTDLERGINIHTFEDQTHSRLFMVDWRRLGLDVNLGWQASDTLWWLFLAEANEVNRRHGSYFLALPAADGNDPLLRFAHAEVAEMCARDLFFKHASRVAQTLADETGVECLYLGQHHIDAEGEGAEGLFETQVLDGPRRERAQQLVDIMFGVFTEIFDSMLSYAETFVATGDRPRRHAVLPAAPLAGAPATGGDRGVGLLDGPVHPTQQKLAALLRERVEGAGRHPLRTWLNHRGPRLSAEQALRRFFPMWAVDVMGTHDLVEYTLRYPEPGDGEQAALNGWASALAARSAAYLEDWRVLQLDERLGWAASETFEFCYLDRLMDTFRHNRIRLIELASVRTEPLVRLWLLAALDAAAEVFSTATGTVAAEAERNLGGRLDYLSGRYRARTPAELSELARLAEQPMTADQCAAASQIIETVFGAFDEQLDISLDVALSDYLELG